jgi:hypothetical protein
VSVASTVGAPRRGVLPALPVRSDAQVPPPASRRPTRSVTRARWITPPVCCCSVARPRIDSKPGRRRERRAGLSRRLGSASPTGRAARRMLFSARSRPDGDAKGVRHAASHHRSTDGIRDLACGSGAREQRRRIRSSRGARHAGAAPGRSRADRAPRRGATASRLGTRGALHVLREGASRRAANGKRTGIDRRSLSSGETLAVERASPCVPQPRNIGGGLRASEGNTRGPPPRGAPADSSSERRISDKHTACPPPRGWS